MEFCLLLKIQQESWQKLFNHAKQSATDALKTASNKSIQNSRSNW